MHIPKHYFDNRSVLALLSINVFLVISATLSVLLRLDGGDNGSYIVSYRSNLGLDAFSAGSAIDFVYFIVLGFFVLVLHTYLSMRLYHVRKFASIAVLALATLLLVLIVIITNALFVLR